MVPDPVRARSDVPFLLNVSLCGNTRVSGYGMGSLQLKGNRGALRYSSFQNCFGEVVVQWPFLQISLMEA